MFANNALLGGGVRVRVWIREQRSEEDQDTTKPLMAVLDITLSLIRTFQLSEHTWSQCVWINDFLLYTDDQWTRLPVKDSPSHYVDLPTVQDVFSSLYCSYFLDTIRRRLYKQWIISVWKGNPRCRTKPPPVQDAYLPKPGLTSFTERWWLISRAEKAPCMLSLASSPGLPLLQFLICLQHIFFACNTQKMSAT